MNSAIVLVIDRLSAGFLGPYGNTWIETPSFNRLAAASALFEFALTDSPDLSTVYRSWWSGVHAMGTNHSPAALAGQVDAAGIHTVLITDAGDLAEHPLASEFRERLLVPTGPVCEAAAEIGQTQLARLLAAAMDRLHAPSLPTPFLLWIHSRGMQGPWDAPAEFREQFADEDDPLPPEFVAPPVRWLQPDEDPDRILGIVHAYAGQLSLLDTCLEAFLDAWDAHCRSPETLLLITSPRGYPLGEHRRIGPVDPAIYGEHLHVPCLVRYPDGAEATVRSHQLVQPADVHATLREWFGLPRAAASNWGQSLTAMLQGRAHADRAAAISGSCRALRTPAWFLHCQSAASAELYAKPDDRWEANEVSDRCRDVLPELLAIAEQFARAAQADGPPQFAPLPQIAVDAS